MNDGLDEPDSGVGDDDLLEETLALIEARTPEVARALRDAPAPTEVSVVEGVPCPTLRVDGIQLCGAVDPEGEALLQASRVPPSAREATVYEPAQGELPRALLGREVLSALEVVLLSPAVFRQVIALLDQRDWLADPRVTLRLARPDERPAEPWALSPAGLRLCAPEAWALRDRLVLALSAGHQSAFFAEQRERLLASARVNAARFASDSSVSALFGTRRGAHAVVVGSGPTLDDSLEWLAAARGSVLVVAVNSALRSLVRRGLVPDVVVAVDPLPELATHLALPADDPRLAAAWSGLRDVPLVYATTVAPETRAAWGGPALAAHLAQGLYDALEQERPRGRLFCSGTVLHAAIDLAARMGAGRITLLGADFGYPGGRTHADGAPAERVLTRSLQRLSVLDGHGAAIESEVNLVGYLRDLEDWIARHPEVRVSKRGRRGARVRGAAFDEDSR